MPTIMVQMAHHDWTLQALHLACAMSRNYKADVTLVRMLPVQHIGWLGTDYAHTPPTPEEYRHLQQYQATAHDYGVELSVIPMQYISLKEALVDAANELDAMAVFATLPRSGVSYWRKFQSWDMQRHLAAHHRMLYTLEQPSTNVERVPSIAIPAHK